MREDLNAVLTFSTRVNSLSLGLCKVQRRKVSLDNKIQLEYSLGRLTLTASPILRTTNRICVREPRYSTRSIRMSGSISF